MKRIIFILCLYCTQFAAAQPTPQQITNLSLTGQFWGFLKYHHPAVTKGTYDWDAELIKWMPAVMAAKDNQALSVLLEGYLDQLPKPDICKKCAAIAAEKYLVQPDYGTLLKGDVLNESLTEKLNFVKNNHSTGEQYYVKYGSVLNPAFIHEKPYKEMTYPDTAYRMLALFRYWAMVNYFFPDRFLIGEDWCQVLTREIPDFLNAANEKEYAMAVMKLVADIHDTHGGISGTHKGLIEFKGAHEAPFNAVFIEGKLVVTAVYTDTLAKGDIIEKIDDVAVDVLKEKYRPYIHASNEDTYLRNLPVHFLLRSNSDYMHLTVNRQGRIFSYDAAMRPLFSNPKNDTTPMYRLLDNHIVYFYPAKYNNSMQPEIEKVCADARGLIIDIRNYPADQIAFTLLKFLKATPGPFVTFSTAVLDYPGATAFSKTLETGGGKKTFKGRVIILTNAFAQSSAEYQIMALQTVPGAKVVGSMTGGADGNVSLIELPGGLNTHISGIGVHYPDGTSAQRVGVRIDEVVYPSIKGITAGRDEVLEKAIEMISL